MIARLLACASLVLAPMALAGIAHAQQPAPPMPVGKTYSSYVSVSGGFYNELDFDYVANTTSYNTHADPGFGVGAAWGWRLGSGLRAELGFSFQDHQNAETIATGGPFIVPGTYAGAGDGVTIVTYDANAYFDFAPNQPVNVYMGAGVGYAGFYIDDGAINESSLGGPTLQGMTGVEFQTTETMRIFVEARYRLMWLTTGNELGDVVDIDTSAVSGSAGLRFLF